MKVPEQRFAKSLPEFMDITAEIIVSWSSLTMGEARPWYRGQMRAEWNLVPSEYRYENLSADELRTDFALKARALLPSTPVNDWEWYFLMQHYGLPTRLVDWTMGSLIALHFALCHETGAHDASVWVIDPWALNQWSLGTPDLMLTTESKAAAYLPPTFSNKMVPIKPIVPLYNSARITVQRGVFTVHGSNIKGIDQQFSKRLIQIVIPKDCTILIRRQLRSSGISEFTLFPDLDGLCRDIHAFYIEGC